MLVSEIFTVAAAVVTFVSAVAASSCCAYICSRNDQHTIELLRQKRNELSDLIEKLKEKHSGGVAVIEGLPQFLSDADKKNLGMQDSISQLEEKLDRKCIRELVPNLWAQKQARSKMEKDFSKLKKLVGDAQDMCRKPVKGRKQLPAEVTIIGERSNEIAEEIWSLVRDSSKMESGVICIYGGLGVGKTAIARNIHDKALNEDKLFDCVIWAGWEYGVGPKALRQVQEDIARSIEIDLPKSDQTRETTWTLKNALLKKGKFLLVLDSMWESLSLDAIGIPELVSGRKLILTSRKSTVCDDIRNSILREIQPLDSEDEMWMLFEAEIDQPVTELKVETVTSIKKALLADLDGLPCAISCFAQKLNSIQRHNPVDSTLDSVAWREELDKMHKEPKLMGRFKQSYNNLSKATRSCFLYCAFFPKNHSIEVQELIEYWIWEGFLGDNIKTLEQGYEKGRDILEELEEAHLLETHGSSEYVNMLGLVRSMAISTTIDEERQPIFVKSGCSLICLPLGHEWPRDVEKASFMNNELRGLNLRKKTNYSHLSTLLLQNNPHLAEANDPNNKFFKSTSNLKILDLSRTIIGPELPTYISSLTKLQALLLRGCSHLTTLPDLSELELLIVLDLAGTPIQECPTGISRMAKLRRLNLSKTRVRSFPNNVVASLAELEELLMITKENCVWTSTESEQQQEGACIEDLYKLEKLAVLELHFLDVHAFNKYISSAEVYAKVPNKFRFRVGDVKIGGGVEQEQNSLIISDIGVHGASSDSDLGILRNLRDVTVLDVSNFGKLYLLSAEILHILTKLKEIRVRSCEEVVEIVEKPTKSICLPELTKMLFFDLPKLSSVCSGQELHCPKLQSIEVWRCENLQLPVIHSDLKICIRGESSWFSKLDNPGNSVHPHSNFTFEVAPVPPELMASTAKSRKDPVHQVALQNGCNKAFNDECCKD